MLLCDLNRAGEKELGMGIFERGVVTSTDSENSEHIQASYCTV